MIDEFYRKRNNLSKETTEPERNTSNDLPWPVVYATNVVLRSQVNIDSKIHAQIDADLRSCFEGFDRVKYAYESGTSLIPGVSVDADCATIQTLEREAARRASTQVLLDQEVYFKKNKHVLIDKTSLFRAQR